MSSRLNVKLHVLQCTPDNLTHVLLLCFKRTSDGDTGLIYMIIFCSKNKNVFRFTTLSHFLSKTRIPRLRCFPWQNRSQTRQIRQIPQETNYIKQHFLLGVMFNISLVLISILRSTINNILSKFHLLTKVWSLLLAVARGTDPYP